MEKVLISLEKYANSDVDLESRYILLLWLIILCKNPFDFDRIKGRSQTDLAARIIDVALPYICKTASKYQVIDWLIVDNLFSICNYDSLFVFLYCNVNCDTYKMILDC